LSTLFELTLSPLELIVRGTVMYLGLVLAFRFILRRDVGSMGIPDVLFIVIIADAAQNAMSGEYKSIADGTVLVATLVFWNVALDWLAFRSRAMRRLIEPPSLPLVRDGKWVRRNLRREWITTEEVLSKLRERGIEGVSQVKIARLEADGELGVIRNDDEQPEASTRRRPVV